MAIGNPGAVEPRDVSLPDTPELLTARDLEAILKISMKTIYGYVQRGLIPYVKIQSNVRFPKKEILIWIQDQSYQPKAFRANISPRQ